MIRHSGTWTTGRPNRGDRRMKSTIDDGTVASDPAPGPTWLKGQLYRKPGPVFDWRGRSSWTFRSAIETINDWSRHCDLAFERAPSKVPEELGDNVRSLVSAAAIVGKLTWVRKILGVYFPVVDPD